jgi:hypothetical protein
MRGRKREGGEGEGRWGGKGRGVAMVTSDNNCRKVNNSI